MRLASNWPGRGWLVLPVQADLATREGVDELWSRIESMGSPLDVACVNAGVGVGGLFRDTDLDEELKMIALNCSGTIQLAKCLVEQMLRQGSGKILFTASIAGEMVAPREAVYAATKAFVLSFAHSLNYELRDANITVTALQPGPTDTDFLHRAGMDNTKVGREGKSESHPDDVARQGPGCALCRQKSCVLRLGENEDRGSAVECHSRCDQGRHAREDGQTDAGQSKLRQIGNG
jgi:uncharacterized protein